MDVATHALASFALARGFFPRRRWPVVVGMLVGGTIADVDLLSSLFGPAAYFAARGTYTHSILGTIVLILLIALFFFCFSQKRLSSAGAVLLPISVAAAFHVILDILQFEGVALLWPIRPTRFAMDWLPAIDPWILVILVIGIFFPELIRLVTSEIGVKQKAPRGRNGAIVAMVLLGLYIGARALLHAGSVATLEPHSYLGESARNVGSFPNAVSIFTWRGVVETRSLLCTVDVPAGPGRNFDAEAAECVHKPEPSPELDTAQKTRIAKEYLAAVPFPRAVVAKSQDGYEVVIRSMRDLAENETHHRIAARILLDSNSAVLDQELIWASDVHLH